MENIRCYKVFRVDEGELYSAFEGWPNPYMIGSHCNEDKKLHYRVRGITTDPKLALSCPGLMVMTSRADALLFLEACPSTLAKFVLHEVVPITEFTQAKYSSYSAVHTDSLKVGRKIKSNGHQPA